MLLYVSFFLSFRVTVPPPITWAQRKNMIFLTICVEDCKNPTINIETTKVFFKGTGGAENKSYENTLELFGELDTEVSDCVVPCIAVCVRYTLPCSVCKVHTALQCV